jgi:hypothetical protein
MTWDIESIIDDTEPATTSVTICIKGALRAEYDRLETQLGTTASNSLAGDTTNRAVAERMAELVEQMRAAERTFNLRAVTPRRAWRNLTAKRPLKTPDLDDDAYADLYHPWVCSIVAASAIEPAMTPEQAERLADKLSDGDWQKLANGAWSVNDDCGESLSPSPPPCCPGAPAGSRSSPRRRPAPLATPWPGTPNRHRIRARPTRANSPLGHHRRSAVDGRGPQPPPRAPGRGTRGVQRLPTAPRRLHRRQDAGHLDGRAGHLRGLPHPAGRGRKRSGKQTPPPRHPVHGDPLELIGGDGG